jgi:hypothetical protein
VLDVRRDVHDPLPAIDQALDLLLGAAQQRPEVGRRLGDLRVVEDVVVDLDQLRCRDDVVHGRRIPSVRIRSTQELINAPVDLSR